MQGEEVISSSSGNAATALVFVPKSSSPPPTVSSVGASSPAVATNAGSIDWLGHGQGGAAAAASKAAVSVSPIASRPVRASLSTSAGGSALGSSQPSCRPWERGDLLRRLSTFNPSYWFAKPEVASSLTCARRGWVNVDVDKIKCESCGANLKFGVASNWLSTEAENSGEEFSKHLDEGHKISCPWRGNNCAESLVQFPPTPSSALIGGYKDRCDGLLQFISLPIVAASAIEHMRVSRSLEIDRFLAHLQAFAEGDSGSIPQMGNTREEVICVYSRAQKLISLCGWEPRWLPNVQDCEEHSAQSARNGYSVGPMKGFGRLRDRGIGKKALSALNKQGSGKNEALGARSKCESRSPLLDCILCGATVRISDFLTIARPSRFAPTVIDVPETTNKMGLTHGVSAASGISGWIPNNDMDKEQTEDHDEAAMSYEGKSLSNAGVDLNLTMGGGLSTAPVHTPVVSEHYRHVNLGRDLIIGQPSGSEVGDRATSYESHGPSTHKRNLEDGGSTIDRPNLMMRQADSIEGTVVDRDGDEGNYGEQYSTGPSKRSRDSYAFEAYDSSYRRDSSVAEPSHSIVFEIDRNTHWEDLFLQRNDEIAGGPSTRDSTHVSSVIAMDTVYADNDSMDSVENHPGDMDDVEFRTVSRNPDLNDTSDFNYSNQAQQSVCPAAERVTGEIGVSSTNGDEEVVNMGTGTPRARDGPSFGISAGSVGMGASDEAEIHGTSISVHRANSVVGDVEPVAEVIENHGQNGEFAPDPGLMGDFVPQDVNREYRYDNSRDLMLQSVGREDSGSKIVGSTKGESVESGEKNSDMQLFHENSNHPSLSCDALLCSGYEASKEELTEAANTSPTVDGGYQGQHDLVANSTGPPMGESNFEEAVEFDPIKHHNYFCPWVNGNVAAAGYNGSTSFGSSVSAVALCGWQLTLDALDAFQSLGHVPVQTVESESAASLHKDDHLTSSHKLLSCNFLGRSHGKN